MTTREMLTVNLPSLMGSEEDEATSTSAGIKYFEIMEDMAFYNMMDEEGILVEEERYIEEQEQEDTDVHNPHDQLLHNEEEQLRGKLAIDIPTYTANERNLLAAITHVREYLMDPGPVSDRIAKDLLPFVRKMSKTCTILEGKVMKIKSRGGIREVPDSLKKIKEILKEAHEGGGH